MEELLVAVRVIVSLAAVLGLLLWLRSRLRKGQASGRPLSALPPKGIAKVAALLPGGTGATARESRPERINVVSRAGLGGKAHLVVAEFGGIRYVLGVTEHGINVVDTQEAPLVDDEADAPVAEIGRGDAVERTDGGEPALKSVA